MYRMTLAIAILFAASTVQAQEPKKAEPNVTSTTSHVYWRGNHGWGWGGWHGGWGGWGQHSSTAAEGFMRGQGARAAGYGQWLRALGVYENQHQEALRKHYENEEFRIKKYWETKKFYDQTQHQRRMEEAERNAQIRQFKIAAEETRLKDLESAAALEVRKDALRAAGVLPAKQPQSFVYNGKRYGTYAEFKKTDDYIRLRAAARWKVAMDNAKAKLDAEKQAEALRFLAERSMLTPVQEMQATERSRARRQLSLSMGEAWVKKYIDGEPHFWQNLEVLKNAPAPLWTEVEAE